jgi:hypothetical protein
MFGMSAGAAASEGDFSGCSTLRAKERVKQALECQHRDLLAFPQFRSALKARLDRPVRQRP